MKTIFRPLLAALCLLNVSPLTAQPLNLSSLPAETATIFLDTDGHTVTGTSWNYAGPIYCRASGLSVLQVTEVFNRVAEDFRPFAINVTTDSTKFFAAPLTKRIRVILTIDHQWFGLAGGVAFVNSFTWGDDTPCFVFTAAMNYHTRNISEASSHESGHTLGLFHQSVYDTNCVKTAEYNTGQGNGEIGWAPIMGSAYSQNLTLWNNGPNAFGCQNFQNELDIILNSNNLLYRADDHAPDFSTSTPIIFTGGLATVSGIIERNSDQDMFKIILPAAGSFRLDAVPYNVGTGNAGSNLDMQVTLYNSTGGPLNVYNPGVLLNSIVDTFLNSGTYYLKVEGRGNTYAPDYASLGSYSMAGSFVQAILPLRILELRGSLNADQHLLNWIIDADEAVVQQTVEYSTDGINFIPLIQPGTGLRNYQHIPRSRAAIQYRLRVLFDNGRHFFSNIILLRFDNDLVRPKLLGNIVSTSLVLSSPGSFRYSLFDLNGSIVGKGNIGMGTSSIQLPVLPDGMYLIRFTNGKEIFTDKWVKK